MATTFNRGKESANMLLEAAELIDRAMTWSTTQEGQDFWEKLAADGGKLHALARECQYHYEGLKKPLASPIRAVSPISKEKNTIAVDVSEASSDVSRFRASLQKISDLTKEQP